MKFVLALIAQMVVIFRFVNNKNPEHVHLSVRSHCGLPPLSHPFKKCKPNPPWVSNIFYQCSLLCEMQILLLAMKHIPCKHIVVAT